VIDTVYFKQAELLLRIIPLIDREAVFALKGGTAINFFVRDLPRISVDIDLVYLPISEKQFIVSVKEEMPQWDLIGIAGIENLPAVKWKLLNISRMNPSKHKKSVRKLKDYLEV
jgi:hypothetical protein